MTPRLHLKPSELLNMFPGTNVEGKWTTPTAIENAPQYAMRIALGAQVIRSPAGKRDYVSMILHDSEYILDVEDFEFVRELHADFLQTFFTKKGITTSHSSLLPILCANPDLILQGLRHMRGRVDDLQGTDKRKHRVFWLIPDVGGCGYFRSRLPSAYMKSNDAFHVDASQFCTYQQMSFYDAIVYHRCPSHHVMQLLQRLKLEGKLLIYDTDDDFLNIPVWNVAHQYINDDDLERAKAAIELADICFTTNEHLAKAINREDAFVAPNLVNLEDYASFLSPGDRPLHCKFKGYRFVTTPKGVRVQHQKTGAFMNTDTTIWQRDYRPLTIAWFGSNTHDADLEQIINPVRRLVKEYGMAIRIVFFGYCPPEFIEVVTQNGNTSPQILVKDEFSHAIQYVAAVPHSKFFKTLTAIEADIGLCPVSEHDFNRSKSNLKALEFGAMRVPVITSDFSTYDFIEDRKTGLKVPVSNEGAWYDAIAELINNPQLRSKLAHNIYDTVSAEYSWQNASENRNKWNGLFGRIAEKITERKYSQKEVNV